MAHFGNFLKRIRNQLGLSQGSFAKVLGLETREAVGQIEAKAERRLRGDTLEAILRLLDYKTAHELDYAWKSGEIPDIAGISASRTARAIFGRGGDGIASVGRIAPVKWVPVYHGVSACRRDHRENVQIGEVPAADDRAEFAVRIDGECMSPDYPPGSAAVFSRAEADARGIVGGKDYLIWFPDGQVTFKRVLRSASSTLTLRCLNPDRDRFPDQEVRIRDVACVALCISVQISKG